MARLVCLLLWPSLMYSRKFGVRLQRKVMDDEIWLDKRPPSLTHELQGV